MDKFLVSMMRFSTAMPMSNNVLSGRSVVIDLVGETADGAGACPGVRQM